MKYVVIAVLLSFSLGAAAQTVTEEPAKKPVAKTEPKKPAPKKVVAKKTPPAKPAAAPKIYVNDPKAPVLLDKTGNPIATNPNAYDVSSAVGKK